MLPIFDISGGLKVFISLNIVEEFFERSSFFERFCCSTQFKLETFFLEINLAQVSSLRILEIHQNRRADNIFWKGVHLFLLH